MLGSLRKIARRLAPATARSLTTRATAARKPSALTLATLKPTRPVMRAMSSQAAPATAAAAAPAHPDDAVATELPQGGLLNRGYELYPALGLGLAAAITQEWLVFDEYWITASCYAGVMYTGYLFAHDKILKSGTDGFAKDVAQTKAAFGVRLDMLKRYAMMEEYALSFSTELRALYAQEAKVNAMAVDYKNLKLRHDARTTVLAKLNSIKVLEDDARTQAIAALSKKAGEYVATAYASAPAAVKEKNVEAGIAAIAPELTTRSIALSRSKPAAPLAADDPVKMLFDEFLATPRTYAQLGVEDYAAKFMERKDKTH